MASPQLPDWISGADPVLAVLLTGLLPGFEPRYAVVVGLYLGLSLPLVLGLAVAEVLALSIVLGTVVSWIDSVLPSVPLAGKIYSRYRISALRRARPVIDKWGSIGLVVFVAIPVPATGIYTGSVAGMLLGITGRRLSTYLALGGLLSVAITLAASYTIMRW